MRKLKFETEHFYHIYNRGVENRRIFLDKEDYRRFTHCLFEFNDSSATTNLVRRFGKNERGTLQQQGPTTILSNSRELLVDIIVFCLMPNHFHLILKQIVENGITRFLHKLGTGYTKYFNTRRERVGSLFQGPFKAIHIDSDEYLTHLSRYIHLNPVEIIQPRWKEDGIQNLEGVEKFLKGYKWSSYPDYIGERNFPHVINKEFLLEYFGDGAEYERFVMSWLSQDLEIIKDFMIEA